MKHFTTSSVFRFSSLCSVQPFLSVLQTNPQMWLLDLYTSKDREKPFVSHDTIVDTQPKEETCRYWDSCLHQHGPMMSQSYSWIVVDSSVTAKKFSIASCSLRSERIKQ